MTSWGTAPIDRRARLSIATMITVSGIVFGLLLFDATTRTRTANQIDAVFSEPRAIDWSGVVSRIFLGGGTLEIVGKDVPGGAFQASLPDGQTPTITGGRVRVIGRWHGTTCAYGGYRGQCVPDIEITAITQIP